MLYAIYSIHYTLYTKVYTRCSIPYTLSVLFIYYIPYEEPFVPGVCGAWIFPVVIWSSARFPPESRALSASRSWQIQQDLGAEVPRASKAFNQGVFLKSYQASYCDLRYIPYLRASGSSGYLRVLDQPLGVSPETTYTNVNE